MTEFRNIAVIRASALGDFIFALPALTALREMFPEAKVSYLGKQWHKDLLGERESLIDQVIVVPPVAGVGEKETFPNDHLVLKKFFRRMQKEKFDVAIQLHGGGRYSNPFVRNLGANYTIGTKTPDAQALDKTIPYDYYQSEYIRWLEVVSLIGAKTTQIMPRIDPTSQDIEEAYQALQDNIKNIIVLHPGATDKRRRWRPERFAEVADYFAQKGFRIVVTGTNDEKSVVENVIGRMRGTAENFYNKLSLKGLTGLLSLADLVISNDTGPLHLADALGCKTVGIYWCGNMINGAPPYRKKSRCLASWMTICPLCHKDCASFYPFDRSENDCQHETSFVDGVGVKEVITSAEELLHM